MEQKRKQNQKLDEAKRGSGKWMNGILIRLSRKKKEKCFYGFRDVAVLLP